MKTDIDVLLDQLRTYAQQYRRGREMSRTCGNAVRAIEKLRAQRDEARGALCVAQVAFDCLDPANHDQASDSELAKLITTARQTVGDALSKLDQQEGRR